VRFVLKITVWTNGPACVACTMTKKEFDKRGIIYQERDLRRNPKAVERFLEMGLSAAPIVETDVKRWAGFRLEKIKSLDSYLKSERNDYKPEPMRQVADEVEDEGEQK
jgi:glutaredoxin-like protein NrdH